MPDEKKPELPMDQVRARLKDAARRSGRPLEVVCAQSFLEAPAIAACSDSREAWKVELSSYYQDGLSDKVRELDVLARRQRFVKVSDSGGFNCLLEAFVSCKGFSEDEYPVSYSVRKKVELQPEHPPVLPYYLSRPNRPKTGQDAARMLLWFMCDMDSVRSQNLPRTVGFDIIKPQQNQPAKDWKPTGDKPLFEGLDSALRGSLFWMKVGVPTFHSSNEGLLRVQVPVLVLSRPWQEISLDGGNVGDPVDCNLGYTANLYPIAPSPAAPAPIMTIVIAREMLPQLQKALVNLYGQMWDWAAESWKNAV